jgi:hypothetical protein
MIVYEADPELTNKQEKKTKKSTFKTNVHTCLDEKFPMWIGRHGKINWPPRPPDLTPCDFAM